MFFIKTPNTHNLANQTAFLFDPCSIQQQEKQYHTGSMVSVNHYHHHQQQQHNSLRQFYPSSTSIQHQNQSYNHFHHINSYSQDTSNIYDLDHQTYVSDHCPQTHISYEANNNYCHQQYDTLRPVMASEHYSTYYPSSSVNNEHVKTDSHLLHSSSNSNNNNNSINASNYIDLTTMINENIEEHYDYHRLNDKKEDEHSSYLLSISNESHFHWNQTGW